MALPFPRLFITMTVIIIVIVIISELVLVIIVTPDKLNESQLECDPQRLWSPPSIRFRSTLKCARLYLDTFSTVPHSIVDSFDPLNQLARFQLEASRVHWFNIVYIYISNVIKIFIKNFKYVIKICRKCSSSIFYQNFKLLSFVYTLMFLLIIIVIFLSEFYNLPSNWLLTLFNYTGSGTRITISGTND